MVFRKLLSLLLTSFSLLFKLRAVFPCQHQVSHSCGICSVARHEKARPKTRTEHSGDEKEMSLGGCESQCFCERQCYIVVNSLGVGSWVYSSVVECLLPHTRPWVQSPAPPVDLFLSLIPLHLLVL